MKNAKRTDLNRVDQGTFTEFIWFEDAGATVCRAFDYGQLREPMIARGGDVRFATAAEISELHTLADRAAA